MTISDVFKAIPQLKFTELQAYLRNTGWKRAEANRSDIGIFHKETNSQFFETLLPLNKDFADYNQRILEVLEAIAQVENRNVHQVLTDLSLPPGDIVRFRIINKDTIGGTISFLEGFNLLESAKKALFTTACDIIQPEKYHRRLGLKAAQQFIEECRLGQTEKGSFVASIICPFINDTPEDKGQQLSIFNKEEDFRNSFTRKVTIRMMKALDLMKTAIEMGEQNRIMDLDGDEIISANFLESIVELHSSKENTELEVQTSWSVFAPEEMTAIRSIKFSNDYIPVIENIINEIKPVDEDINDEFIGRISQTKADPDPRTRTEGEILLNYIFGDEEKVSKARVILNATDYEQACEAHRNGRTVKVKGRLVTIGRSKVIENPEFHVMQ